MDFYYSVSYPLKGIFIVGDLSLFFVGEALPICDCCNLLGEALIIFSLKLLIS